MGKPGLRGCYQHKRQCFESLLEVKGKWVVSCPAKEVWKHGFLVGHMVMLNSVGVLFEQAVGGRQQPLTLL